MPPTDRVDGMSHRQVIAFLLLQRRSLDGLPWKAFFKKPTQKLR
jgi:hypothetical protein